MTTLKILALKLLIAKGKSNYDLYTNTVFIIFKSCCCPEKKHVENSEFDTLKVENMHVFSLFNNFTRLQFTYFWHKTSESCCFAPRNYAHFAFQLLFKSLIESVAEKITYIDCAFFCSLKHQLSNEV